MNFAHSSFCFRRNFVCIFFVWIIGLFLGVCLYGPIYSTLMYSVVHQPVSIIGLIMIWFLPLFAVYASYSLNKPFLSFIVCFLKAVAFGFSGCLITENFGSASWLVRFLLLFSDHCCVIILFVFWAHIFCSNVRKHTYIFYIFAALIAVCDYFIISPFAIGLF